jgi:ATP-dependent Clp protease adaptor protein ClpS
VYNTAVDFDIDQSADTALLDDIDEPPLYSVVMFNDDYTTMDFVTDVLMTIFDKSAEEAERLMKKIHKTGKAVAGVYAYDVAATKAAQAKTAARASGYPLRCELEMT